MTMNEHVLNNKWSGGKVTWDRLAISGHILNQACVMPMDTIMDPAIGLETILLIIDPTDFIHQLAALKPFRLNLSTGVVRTDYGPVAFFLYEIPGSDPNDPFALFEQTLNPFDDLMLRPFYDLARQSYWHVFLVDGQGREVNWFEFDNNFRVREALDNLVEATKRMSCEDFDQAKAQYNSMYTMRQLFEMTRTR